VHLIQSAVISTGDRPSKLYSLTPFWSSHCLLQCNRGDEWRVWRSRDSDPQDHAVSTEQRVV